MGLLQAATAVEEQAADCVPNLVWANINSALPTAGEAEEKGMGSEEWPQVESKS